MAYKFITKYDSPNFGYGYLGKHGENHPKQIVIHYWGKTGQKFENVINWLCNPKSQVSAHYVLEDGRVACLVDCADAAWHAGDAYVNQHSIGIECRPEMTKGDLDTLVDLIVDIWKVYGKLPLIGHKDVVDTSCPGPYYNKLKEITRRAEEKMSGKKPDYRVAIAAYMTTENNERFLNVYKDELENTNVQGKYSTIMTVKTDGERTVWTGYDAKKKKVSGKKLGYTKKKGTKLYVNVVHKF